MKQIPAESIKYKSTRGHGLCRFEEVVLSGLATDSGLFVPEHIPKIDPIQLEQVENCNLAFFQLLFRIRCVK
jgi:threonine synthase